VTRRAVALWLVGLTAAAVYPVVLSRVLANPGYVFHLTVLWGVYAMLAQSNNIVTGLAGQLSIGQAAFFGIGAYVSSLLALRFGLSFWVLLGVAGLAAALVGILIALPLLRLRGIYFGLATLAFGEIVFVVAENWDPVTGGYVGVRNIPPATLGAYTFAGPVPYYYLVVVLNLGLLVVVRQLRVSQIGRVLFALREDHIAAEAIGIDGTRYRILAFGLSSLVAGVAGSFFAHYATYIAPTNFTTTESIAILTMMILGGMGTTLGPIVGSGLLTLLPEFLRIVASYRIVLYGLLLVLFALFRPQGIVGTKRPGARPAPFGPGGIAGTREPYAASRA